MQKVNGFAHRAQHLLNFSIMTDVRGASGQRAVMGRFADTAEEKRTCLV